MKHTLLRRLGGELGAAGIASLVLFAGAAAFYQAALRPLQDRSVTLQAELARQARLAPGQPASAAERLGAFYRFLDKPEATTDWLAKLHGIGAATGLQMQAATYRTHEAGGKLERYEIVLPVSGSYAQVREFLRRALAEIPVLSLDQMSLRRESRNDGAVQAELRLSLHQVKP